MDMPTRTVHYLDPFSPPGAIVEPYAARLDPGLKTPTIALFSNLFVDATIFLEDIARAVHALIPGATFRRYDKGHVRNASFPAPAELIQQIKDECDAVILAYGHCGSCTGGLVRDTVALAKAGVPLASLVTRKFIDEAHFIARAGGVPDVPYVFLPHPIAGETAEYHRAVARIAAPAIITALLQGRGDNIADRAAAAVIQSRAA
jgi:hypothetical protein